MYKLSQFEFKPSKKIIFTSKEKNRLIEYQTYKLKPIPKSQKVFSTIVPVKPFNRFIKSKIANTGVDPGQTFINFINKDIPKPYKSQLSPLSNKYKENINFENTKWTLGTTCNCRKKEFLPKFQQFKNYYFISNKDNDKNDNLRNTYLSTDHIKIKTSRESETIDVNKERNKRSILNLKKLNINCESNSFWIPYEHSDDNNFNRSSVDYNIINYRNNTISGKRETSLLEKSINNKKKGISEFSELQRNFEPNYRPKFSQMLKENNNIFMKYKGAFTQLYDSYNKNGNVFQPFSKSNSNEKINYKNKNLKIII